MCVIEINDVLYEINRDDYEFVKDKVNKYLFREVSKTELKQIIDRIVKYDPPAIAEISIKSINEGEFGIKYNIKE